MKTATLVLTGISLYDISAPGSVTRLGVTAGKLDAF